EAGATSLKDMGRVMKILMPKVAGRAEGKVVNELVRSRLG
ncbi:MAG: GatB/YqeY domain-containing protein, partial [Syntrophobacteraceae bacterium]